MGESTRTWGKSDSSSTFWWIDGDCSWTSVKRTVLFSESPSIWATSLGNAIWPAKLFILYCYFRFWSSHYTGSHNHHGVTTWQSTVVDNIVLLTHLFTLFEKRKLVFIFTMIRYLKSKLNNPMKSMWCCFISCEIPLCSLLPRSDSLKVFKHSQYCCKRQKKPVLPKSAHLQGFHANFGCHFNRNAHINYNCKLGISSRSLDYIEASSIEIDWLIDWLIESCLHCSFICQV